MTKTVLKRIKEKAVDYSKSNEQKYDAFISGAKYGRNKVLNEAIYQLNKVQGSWSYAQVISLLESLKIKQP